MKIIGDKLIPFEEFSKVFTIEDIKNTKANSSIFFDFNEELLSYSFKENLNFFVQVNSIKEAIYANSLNAKYIVCKKNLAKDIQKIADNYIFDSKILAIIKNSNEIEDIAILQIDGAIYKDII